MVDAQVSFNIFDGGVLLLLFLSALLSLSRGFIREFLSLTAWVGAALFTLTAVEGVSEMLLPHVKKPFAATVIATIGTYFVALMTLSVIGSIIMRYVKTGDDVGALDNIFGLLFGIVKGWVIVVLMFFLMTMVIGPEDYPEPVKSAYLKDKVEGHARKLAKMLPSYLGDISMLSQNPDDEEEVPSIDEQDFDLEPSDEQDEQPTDGQGYDQQDVLELQRLLQGNENNE